MNKTKKTAPIRRKTVTAAAEAARVPSYRVHVHPRFAEFYPGDQKEPESRIENGAEGSDAASKLACVIAKLENDGVSLSVVRFDEQGREIAFRS